jgi:hypothetical protein
VAPTSPFLTRIEAVLKQGRETVEQTRRFLATNPPSARRGPAEDLLPGLLALASARVELSTGYRYLFENQPALLGRIGAVLEHERGCCRFLRFHLAFDPNRGPISLEVSGPEGARAYLGALGAPDRDRAEDFAQKLRDERSRAWINKAG